ncbi:ParA family protein [Mesorhizobium sp. M0091]|uniref:ParA family protein n=1 Tax=Mesorhizobium sp. M0091 TaxID=2956875 RepID=UPI00333B265E
MTAITICMASAKGGSGKTTLTATFAAFLSEIGKKILIIDCDEATNGLTLLYLTEVNKRVGSDGVGNVVGLFDNLDKREGDVDQIFGVIGLSKSVDLIPATFNFLPKSQISPDEFLNRIRYIIKESKNTYDYIFLDAQAGSDVVSQAAVRRDVSDEVVIVSEYDPLSAAGVERLKSIMGDDLSFTRTWMLLNKMLPEFVKSFSEFLSVARYLSPIPWTADVVRAYSKRELALDFEVGNQFTLAVMRTLKSLVPHADGLALDQWAEGKASALRQPIENQYEDQERKLKYVYTEMEKLEKENAFATLMSTMLTSLLGLSVAVSTIGLFSPDSFAGFWKIILYTQDKYVLFLSIIAVICGVSIFIISVRKLYFDKTAVSRKIERDKLYRQKEIAEVELKKLEALRDADLASIIEKRAQKSISA